MYRDDAVAAIEAAIAAGPVSHGEAYNIAQGEVVDMPTYIKAVAAVMGKPTPTVKYTAQAPFVSLPSALFGPLSVQKAQDELGFKSTPMREFLAETVKWWGNKTNLQGRPLGLAKKLPPEVQKARGNSFSYDDYQRI